MAPREAAVVCVVVGVLVRDGSLLLVRRAPWMRVFPGAWGPFGGHVDSGETVEEALRREAREELGIEVIALRHLGQVYVPVEPALAHVFAVLSWGGEPENAAPDEHTDVRWFGLTELPDSRALDAYGTLIEAPPGS